MDNKAIKHVLDIKSLAVFGALKEDPVIGGLGKLLERLALAGADRDEIPMIVELYSSVVSALYPVTSDLGEYIRKAVLADDNFYVEAFACGVPVVSTRCGGPEDLVNSTNGILVDRDSVPALAAGMEQMLAERGRFDPQAIRQAAYNQYDQGVLAKTQLACFRKVLSDRA